MITMAPGPITALGGFEEEQGFRRSSLFTLLRMGGVARTGLNDLARYNRR